MWTREYGPGGSGLRLVPNEAGETQLFDQFGVKYGCMGVLGPFQPAATPQRAACTLLLRPEMDA